MYLYTYEITVTPPQSDFNAKNLRPMESKVFVRFATSKSDAVEQFKSQHFPMLRRNGIVRGLKQALSHMTIRRTTSHKVGA